MGYVISLMPWSMFSQALERVICTKVIEFIAPHHFPKAGVVEYRGNDQDLLLNLTLSRTADYGHQVPYIYGTYGQDPYCSRTDKLL
jgi:hypothetical protein